MNARRRFIDEVNLIVRESSALANSIRVMILAVVAFKGEASWHEIRDFVEGFVGDVNPNTLAFHINRLAEAGYIARVGPRRSPKYLAKVIPERITSLFKYLKAILEEE